MPAYNTEAPDEVEIDSRFNVNEIAARISHHGQDGSLAMLVGGALLVSALKSIWNNEGRAILLALTSFTVLGIGLHQRRAEQREDSGGTGTDDQREDDNGKKLSDEALIGTEQDLGAHRNADESASVYQSKTEPNPRGMTNRADVHDDEGGDLDFVEGESSEPHRETHLEDDTAHDPRLHHKHENERTQIDLSEAAMADETSEAAGPHPEQSYPAREGTDPEPTSRNAPEWKGEEAAEGSGSAQGDSPADDGPQEDENGSE